MRHVGKPVAKIDALALVTGRPVYTSDLDLNDQALVVQLLRSPHASARIRAIDTDAARSLAGVACVLTHADVPATRSTLAGQSFPEPSPYDRRILDDRVRYVGDPVAIVAAQDEATARAALALIRVDWDLLTPVLDPETALDNVNRVHTEQPFTHADIGTDATRNIAAAFSTGWGEVETELAESAVVIEQSYTTQAQAHAMMETHRATTSLDAAGRLQVMTSTQVPFHVRRHLARLLGLPASRIRVLKPRVGGGFGGKQTVSVEMYPAIVTLKTGRPARLVYSRSETFACTTSRHAMHLTVRLGADRDGTLRAVDIRCLSDTGAYGEHAFTVFAAVSQKTLPLYGRARACRYHGHAVYTNRTPAGALRGYGATQGAFALESAMNELAAKLGLDPIELRLQNLIEAGESHPLLAGSTAGRPVVLGSSSLRRCIARGRELIGWERKFPRVQIDADRVRGCGMAVSMQGSGIAGVDSASVLLKLNDDGWFTLSHAATDMGQGSDTVLAQIAAEALEVDLERIVVAGFDLDTLPYDCGAYASSGAYVTGRATLQAAGDMVLQVRTVAAGMLGVHADEVRYAAGICTAADGREVGLEALARRLASFAGRGQLVSVGTFGSATSPPFMAGFAEVEVDLRTGAVRLVDFVAVADCGRVLNPNLARLQAEGGLVMGIGLALYEEVRENARGALTTDSFLEYRIPSRLDVPPVRVEFVESEEPTGPFGAKSIGEIGCNIPAPAIAAAVANAVGVHCRRLPITAEQVFLGLAGAAAAKS
jgi:CO/xanthine dehydrogenase Mo-binding subunit